MYSVISGLSLKYFTERNVRSTSNPNQVLLLRDVCSIYPYTKLNRVQNDYCLQVYFSYLFVLCNSYLLRYGHV